MQTDYCAAAYIEEGDHLVIDGETKGEVKEVKEEGDHLLLVTTDDEGEVTEWPFAPFDTVEFVTVHDDFDPTPFYQWEVTESEGYSPDERGEHDPSL